MEFATFIVVAILIFIVVGLITAGCGALYDRGVQQGKLEMQQQCVESGYGRWDVWEGKNVFRWNPKQASQ